MINIEKGLTNSIYLSLKESLPYGSTSSSFKFTWTNDVRGEQVVFYPTDLSSTTNKLSKFDIGEGLPQSLTASCRVNLTPGQWSYSIIDTISGTELEFGKVAVIENKTWVVNVTAPKTVKTFKR